MAEYWLYLPWAFESGQGYFLVRCLDFVYAVTPVCTLFV